MRQLLRQYAPSWLVNLPSLIEPAESLALEHQRIAVAPERVLREFAGFLETLAQDQPVVLVLEDLHWADPSTLSLISFLARRQETARLMLLGTYREDEVLSGNHPLMEVQRELQLHGHCGHLPLERLSKAAVSEYLKARFTTSEASQELVSTVHRRSDGNPLFMVNIIDFLVTQQNIQTQNGSLHLSREIDENSVPTTIRQLTEIQLERLAVHDRELLEVASVAGPEFSTAALAAGLGESLEQVENRTQTLARHGIFLKASGTESWSDGTSASRYGFNHALYQNVIYHGVSGAKRARLHRTIGQRLEAGHRGATDDIAAELAVHFERAGDSLRATQYLLQAGRKAMRQSGYQEAINHAAKGLSLIKPLAQTSQSVELELGFELLLGVCLSTLKGYAASEANKAFSNARALSRKIANQSLIFQSLAGLWSFYVVRAEFRSALEMAEQMLKLARTARNSTFFVDGHMAAAMTLFYLGDFVAALDQSTKSYSHYNFKRHLSHTPTYGWDSGVLALAYKAKTLWFLGHPTKV